MGTREISVSPSESRGDRQGLLCILPYLDGGSLTSSGNRSQVGPRNGQKINTRNDRITIVRY